METKSEDELDGGITINSDSSEDDYEDSNMEVAVKMNSKE